MSEETKEHTYKNGTVYKGQWKGNQRHGKGIYKYKGGTVYDGNFENDMFSGLGKIVYSDGT